MRRKLFAGSVIAIGIAVLATGQAMTRAQEGAAPDAEQMKQMQEAMQKWMAMTKPSEHHKRLDHFVGSWNTVTKVFWGGPGSPGMETKGSSEIKWVLGGRFISETITGEFMMPDASGGMAPVPFEGMGMTGYDNYQNMYVGSWADNMSTAFYSFRGGADPSGKTFTFYFEMDEPMLDVRGRMVKMVNKIVDDNKHVLEMYDLHAGPDYKVMEITYTRK